MKIGMDIGENVNRINIMKKDVHLDVDADVGVFRFQVEVTAEGQHVWWNKKHSRLIAQRFLHKDSQQSKKSNHFHIYFQKYSASRWRRRGLGR